MKTKNRVIDHDGILIYGTTGDADPFEYGGGVIYKVKKTGICWWEKWDEPQAKNYIVKYIRIPVNPWKSSMKFASLDDLSKAYKLSRDELRSIASSVRPDIRSYFVEMLCEVYGYSKCTYKIDVLTTYEIIKRWGFLFGISDEESPQIDDDDYIIISSKNRFICGQVSGNLLGAYKSTQECAAVIGIDIKKSGSKSNVYIVDSYDNISLVQWSPDKWGEVDPPKRCMNFARSKWRLMMRDYMMKANKAYAKAARRDNMWKLPERRG